MQKIAIIGGGITGVTAAYSLVRRGFDVTLFERHRYAAMETSFANGGQLSASNAEVWNHPSTLAKAFKWLLTPQAPLLLNPKPSWHKLSWFAEFVACIPKYEANTVATVKLALAAREHLFEWARRENIDFDLKRKGILHIYRSKAGFEHARKVSELLARGGLERRAVTASEMRDIEPTLSGDFHGGFFTESDATGDIHKFTQGLAAAAARRGATILCERNVCTVTPRNGAFDVASFEPGGESATRTFDKVVVCAGTATRSLAATLGDRVNVYPVKGYSITVALEDDASRNAAPEVSLLDDETKLVSSRLGAGRFRVAGTAEFNGFNRNIRADRIDPLVRWVRDCFPGVSTHNVVPWAGLRPMMPDMLPRVMRGRREGVFYNTGHGHLGWTLSAATAELLGDMVSATSSAGRARIVPASVSP